MNKTEERNREWIVFAIIQQRFVAGVVIVRLIMNIMGLWVVLKNAYVMGTL